MAALGRFCPPNNKWCLFRQPQNVSVNLFETTIRVLGGLQSAFLLSGGDRIFLYRALDLGLRLSVRFTLEVECKGWVLHWRTRCPAATAPWTWACASRCASKYQN